MEQNAYAQIAEAYGPYVVTIVVTVASLTFQWLFERQRNRREWENHLAKKSLDACLTLIGRAKAVVDEYMAARDPQSLERLQDAAKELKEYADSSKPLLPTELQEDLHTAAYHIWGRVYSMKRDDFSIDVIGESIDSLKSASDKLSRFVDSRNPLVRSLK